MPRQVAEPDRHVVLRQRAWSHVEVSSPPPGIRRGIQDKAFNSETQLSKTLKGGYRSLGTYPEFQQLMKAALTKEKADRKAGKFKAFYEQIDKQEKSRKRWRWIHNKFLGIGGFIGFLLWLAVIGGVGVGLYYAVIWLWPILMEKLN